tara:strand:+ start:6676 stop:7467 length:792 start_codon:yes stop_codon:yes gene_type:complete
MKTEIREITPSIAEEMLKKNINNRKLSPKHISFLSQEMKAGNWLFDGQPLRFDGFGRVLDGQHRLNAIIASETKQKFLIVSGLTEETFKVMDTGKNRNAADAFSILGAAYASDLAAVSRFIIGFKAGNNSEKHGHKTSNTFLIEWYNENKIIDEMLVEASKLHYESGKIITRKLICSFLFLFSEKHTEQGKAFMYKLCTGLGIELNNPIYVLRKKLIADKNSVLKMTSTYRNAIIIKCWNLYRENKTVTYFKFDNSVKFPVIK